ncbi:MAG: hypothetical protein JW803_09185, partial [Endomicrobiales bacterium]|nr:hypothetical protein [Endomicrobiales bacterium]
MKTNNYLKKTAMAFIAFACLLFISSEVLAAVPLRINYQGRLKQSGLPVNSSVTMRFRIVNSGDTATYWDSGNVGVTVSSGLFNYVLTGGTPDLTTVAWADIVPYLKVTIGGTDLTPLEQINASAYSMYASSSSYSFTTNASGHDHDSTYVNVTGDAMSGQLTVGSSVTITATGMTPGLAVSSGAVFGTTSGNVGIGTVSPSNKLDVNGFIEAGGADTITSNPPTVDSDAGWKLGFYGNQYAMGVASWTMALRMYGWFSIFDNVLPANDASESVPDSNAHVAFSADRSYFAGKVGVGTTSPGSKFELVNGSITVSGTNAGLAVRGWSAGFVQSDADGDLTVGTIG